jgi:hypothetical protein
MNYAFCRKRCRRKSNNPAHRRALRHRDDIPILALVIAILPLAIAVLVSGYPDDGGPNHEDTQNKKSFHLSPQKIGVGHEWASLMAKESSC